MHCCQVVLILEPNRDSKFKLSTFRVEKVRGNMATIVPSTSLSIRRSDPGRSPSFAPSAKVRLSVATSALVLMPVGMLREALEVERRKENKFARVSAS